MYEFEIGVNLFNTIVIFIAAYVIITFIKKL